MGVLLQLAEIYHAASILQVCYYRPTSWAELEIDGAVYPLPLAVQEHFRNVQKIAELRSSPKIVVHHTPFLNRNEYLEGVLSRIRDLPTQTRIIFLDPDTGLEPVKKPELKHVLENELLSIWEEIEIGDILVLYQHQTNKNAQPWIEPKKAQFENAIGIARGSAKIARSTLIARDVILLFAQK